ncbi:hypothetical protein [Thiocystis violacea]|uniref:hypothetical protein n=1 Tax=Thiocystis violacea TaxID=13725 RepID=UPI001908EFC7|nr:hypothetical protein [Thiocystis violacea]MBK1723837.1 hypothetical protein [Thiocystis violacea]
MGERTYTTSNDRGQVLRFPARSAELDTHIRKIVVTDEGKLSIALECEITNGDEEALEQVKNLLTAQRGPVLTSFIPKQEELDL